MKKIILSFVLALSSNSVYSQSQSNIAIDETTQSKSYALLDLGFSAKLLHLNADGPKQISDKKEVKKSPRSLEEILNKKSELKEKQYYLIAGCFSKESNAKRLVSSLINDGYESEIIGQNSQGLFLVSYERFSKSEEAKVALNKLEAEGKSSWIRKQ